MVLDMEYETYREMLIDMNLRIEELKRDKAELQQMIDYALEYIDGFKVAGTRDITCFNKITGRYESVDKDLERILCGFKSINKILEVNGWDKYIDKSLELLDAPREQEWTLDSLITIIDNLNYEIERLRGRDE